MKTVTIVLIFLLLISSFTSCNDEAEMTPLVYQEVSLTLNEGKKWAVPAEMKIYMDSSFVIIDELEEGESLSDDAIEALTRHKNGFVSSCSMQEKGHDVLHEWLIPYLGILESWSKANTPQKKKQVKAELIGAKKLYLEYFK